jgi:nucleotide-binding universal stress UspA family protein
MFNNILLAVDGSDRALQAARVAGGLAREMKSSILRVVVAVEPLPSYLGQPYWQKAISERMSHAEAILKGAQGEIGNIPGEIHTEVIEGSPAEAIIDVAEARHSDLIVLGSNGHGKLGALLGSQSQKVLNLATCPVLLVR